LPAGQVVVIARQLANALAAAHDRGVVHADVTPSNVLVVSPALNSPLKHWTSDEDQARATAEDRLRRSVAELERLGINARGEVGDADPLQAIEDALRTFGADVIVISTHPEGRSNWLERGVVTSARERFAVPITHVVVDLDAEAAGV
jgi:serine/threonine protein kinase